MTDAPIFVVGVARSGTTLLSAMLSAHSRLDCGPESRFFARYRHLDERAYYSSKCCSGIYAKHGYCHGNRQLEVVACGGE